MEVPTQNPETTVSPLLLEETEDDGQGADRHCPADRRKVIQSYRHNKNNQDPDYDKIFSFHDSSSCEPECYHKKSPLSKAGFFILSELVFYIVFGADDVDVRDAGQSGKAPRELLYFFSIDKLDVEAVVNDLAVFARHDIE